MKEIISISLNKDLNEKIIALSSISRKSKSAIIVNAITEYLQDYIPEKSTHNPQNPLTKNQFEVLNIFNDYPKEAFYTSQLQKITMLKFAPVKPRAIRDIIPVLFSRGFIKVAQKVSGYSNIVIDNPRYPNNPQIVKEKRATYYLITSAGIEFCNHWNQIDRKV